ncbi:MAG TPA: ABC transporter permease [Isosphaeraceae bacterium]|jgi:putative ABC transport system permease protein|nr:ABC transporter permease [Isosphaeraceae bacterium]
MSWIALKMLVGDKAKFFGIVLGLTFAALLIAQQGSIFCGLMLRTAGQVYDITGADLWVMDANVRYIDDVKPMIENNLYRVRGVPGVEWAVPLYKGNARAKINSYGIDPQTKRRTKFEVIEQVILLGLDDSSMVGAPPPERMLAGALTDLRRPDAIVVDDNRLMKLFPGEPWDRKPADPSFFVETIDGIRADLSARGLVPSATGPDAVARARAARKAFFARFLGRELEMNDHRAIIVGVCEATRTFQSNAVVYTKYSRAKLFAPQERKVLSYVLAKAEDLAPTATPEERERWIKEVAARIARRTGLRARTSQEFIWDTINYYLKYTGIPINFGITTMLGFLVGTAIAGQTFYNFTIENIKQFGALKAMGATNARIVGMILLQAAVVGLLGYGLGMGLAGLFGVTSRGGELAFYTPWQLLPITGGAVVAICFLSSILSVRRVIVLEPAVVFRG